MTKYIRVDYTVKPEVDLDELKGARLDSRSAGDAIQGSKFPPRIGILTRIWKTRVKRLLPA